MQTNLGLSLVMQDSHKPDAYHSYQIHKNNHYSHHSPRNRSLHSHYNHHNPHSRSRLKQNNLNHKDKAVALDPRN